MPSLEEREQIVKIHLNKTGKKYAKNMIPQLAKACDKFTGAEIESMIKKSVWHAYLRFQTDKKDELLLEDVLAAKENVIPIMDSSKEKILYLENWAKGRALFASANKKSMNKEKARAYSNYENMLNLD